MLKHWILDDAGEPVEVGLTEWAKWFGEIANRIVARDTLPDGTLVSTVFLGIDHGFREGLPPMLWETMAFPGSDATNQFEGEMRRYRSRANALAGHAEIKAAVAAVLT